MQIHNYIMNIQMLPAVHRTPKTLKDKSEKIYTRIK